MWRRAVVSGAAREMWQLMSRRKSSSGSISSVVDSMILRSLKDHYLEISKWNPPPKVDPPSTFSIIKGAMDGNGPVLTRTFGNEEIKISVMKLANIISGVGGEEDDDDVDDDINQLFLHVQVSKPDQDKSLHFLCGLYPDAMGIHSVSFMSKLETSGFLEVPSTYNGRVFRDLDERMRDSLHSYIEERGVNESLFVFLQAWLYVKNHRKLMRWFKTMGTFINEKQSEKED